MTPTTLYDDDLTVRVYAVVQKIGFARLHQISSFFPVPFFRLWVSFLSRKKFSALVVVDGDKSSSSSSFFESFLHKASAGGQECGIAHTPCGRQPGKYPSRQRIRMVVKDLASRCSHFHKWVCPRTENTHDQPP